MADGVVVVAVVVVGESKEECTTIEVYNFAIICNHIHV